MTQPSAFVYIWEYIVEEAQVDAFRRVYGPNGSWVQLFRRDENYLRTELYQDADNAKRFVTIDFWISKAARDAFRQKFKKEFEELDRRCETLTQQERFVGDFHTVTD